MFALSLPLVTSAQTPAAAGKVSANRGAGAQKGKAESRADRAIPAGVSEKNFSELFEHSPFLRTLNLSMSLVLTGVARIEGVTVVTMVDLETGASYTLFQGETSDEGWQLMEVKGDPADVESLTARVKVAGAGGCFGSL